MKWLWLRLIFFASVLSHAGYSSVQLYNHPIQLRRVRRSLDTDIKTLVHAFVMSRVDYCNAIFARSPRYITDKLQCVLNAAANLVTGTHKFDHGLSHLLHEELHWLGVPERIHYKLGVTVHRCLQYKAPVYLVDCCTPVSDILSRRHLWSATRHHLTVPRYRLSTFGRKTFSVTSQMVWNSLQDSLRKPALTSNSFRQSLKTNLFRRYHSAHTAQ